jgi:adenine-specific DNA-methyltransferase
MDRTALLETKRLILQAKNDAMKTSLERNKLGQFATPTKLALEIMHYASTLLPNEDQIRFLDPAFGTGSFFSALLRMFSNDRIIEAVGYEIDKTCTETADELWTNTGLTLHNEDFTKMLPLEENTDLFNLIICNPPYVRHHHLPAEEKVRLKQLIKPILGIPISGLAGLYLYFLILSHAWMAKDGIAGWLIPSEFMDVNYGKAMKHYLLNKVTLLRIHRFDPQDVQFSNALVSSAVVWFSNALPQPDHKVEFSFGNTLEAPAISGRIPLFDLQREAKWSRFPLSEARGPTTGTKLSDLFTVKRGLATGDNKFFIMSGQEIKSRQLPMEFFKPILPSPRYLDVDEIEADEEGNPLLKKPLFLLDCRLPEEEVAERYPRLWDYLINGKDSVANRYLCRNRSPWYRQENRYAAPILCTYMGRQGTKRPFRFILNNSKAMATNSYLLLYPKPNLTLVMKEYPNFIKKIWATLNASNIIAMLSEGRVYGGGLYKMEPKELANVQADHIVALLEEQQKVLMV